MSEFWSDCLSLLKQKLSVQQYDAWIRPLSARESDGKLLVTAPSRKALEWVREQYLPDMQKLAEQRGDLRVIEIDVGARKVPREEAPNPPDPAANPHCRRAPPAASVARPIRRSRRPSER